MKSGSTESPDLVGPKLFVSYSWTSPDHEAWVLRLATELRESGVDVILDKWDLKEGHDAHAFMEKMVSDPEIKKVILICDKMYAAKADGRSGGVGTEAQIISAEIYAKQAQGKFVAIVRERDEDGTPCVPVYYRSRIYVDLSDASTYSENFEKLLRWVYDKPLHLKPELGVKPPFLSSENSSSVSLATSSRFRRAIDALRNGRDYAIPAVGEYFDLLATELEKLRVTPDADPFDDPIVQSIEAFLPCRNEVIDVFVNLAIYSDTTHSRTILHRFFEQIIPYLYRPQETTRYREWDWDNFRFIVHEIFLYAIAALIKYERFESAAYLINTGYYVASKLNSGNDVLEPYTTIRQYMSSLDYRKKRLSLGRLSLRADMLKERCKGTGVEFRHLMQADFVLFLRSPLDPDQFEHWFPETLLYANHSSGPFEIFARARSKDYFERVKCLLGNRDKEALGALFKILQANPSMYPRWDYESFNAAYLLGYEKLCSLP